MQNEGVNIQDVGGQNSESAHGGGGGRGVEGKVFACVWKNPSNPRFWQVFMREGSLSFYLNHHWLRRQKLKAQWGQNLQNVIIPVIVKEAKTKFRLSLSHVTFPINPVVHLSRCKSIYAKGLRHGILLKNYLFFDSHIPFGDGNVLYLHQINVKNLLVMLYYKSERCH